MSGLWVGATAAAARRAIDKARAGRWAAVMLCVGAAVALCGTSAAVAEPKLVVVVSVDQWAYRYFLEFQDRFPEDGLVHRVQESGAWFENCHHGHAFTRTGPGHSVLLTGAYPQRNGIIDNTWFDRQSDSGRYCVSDADAQLIGAVVDDQPVSPKLLLCETVGDRLKAESQGRSKVFGIAIKDRAAILMVGRRGDGAFWMSNSGYWITTDSYRSDLPGYLRVWNEQHLLARFADAKWEPLYPADHYRHGSPEESFGERAVYGMSDHFPHDITAVDDENFVYQLACSPFGNEATLQAAWELLQAEQLGRDAFPDLLAINLSSNDYVGHTYGPESLEVEDMTYRTDRQLSKWMDRVDQWMEGRGWVLYLTADHGVAPIPERLARAGIPVWRDPWGEADSRGNLEQARVQLEAYLRQELGLSGEMDDLVQAVTDTQVYFHREHDQLHGERFVVAQKCARDWLLQQEVVAAAMTRDDLLGAGELDSLSLAMQRSFHPQRSGDVLFVMRPYAISGTAAANHGSPWNFDTHVPLMIWEHVGTGQLPTVRAGRYTQRVSPAAIASSICLQLGLEPPSSAQETPLPAVELDTR